MQLRIVELLVISIFPVAGLVFYTLSLTGCVSDSPGLPSIFLVAINSSSTAELRIGYFGVCISGNNSHNCVATPYSTTPQSLSVALTSQLGRGGKGSLVPSLRTLETALQLQRSIFFCLQAFAGVLFIISILLFITRVCIQISKRRAQSWRLIEQGWPEKVLVASVAISVISAASTTQTGNALQFATKRLGAVSLHIKVGDTLQVLEWLAFAFSITFYVVIVKRVARGRNEGLPGGEKLTSFPMPPPPPRGLQPPPPPPPPP
ncbi:hypothetical protein FOWG_17818 [Fusarium oxysporum f. sp. lycopersici MN25]|nr:hypothetical protein FOWG_17818 [Fusarium oxysporum f. sp. lycopersici MN25]